MLKGSWQNLLINCITNFILLLKFFNLCSLFLIFWFFFVLVVGGEIDFIENIEKWKFFNLFGSCCFLLLVFLLHDFNSQILALFPFNGITIASLNIVSIKFKLFFQRYIWEPFILREVEHDSQVLPILSFRSCDILQML